MNPRELPIVVERYHPDGIVPQGSWVWVFGSNLEGRHGKGAAKVARSTFGARTGVASGATGRAYAIPTKARPTMKPEDVLPIAEIAAGVRAFIDYAASNPGERFFVTRVGCGLAGIKDEKIAPLFAPAPGNCSLPEQWMPLLG